MNKQIEQAYWNGFATKCAEMGVDAEKLAQAVPEFRAVGTEAVANANRRAAAKASEPDWLDTPKDYSDDPLPGSAGQMDTDLFQKNEVLRLNRALSAGNTNAPVAHDRHGMALRDGWVHDRGVPSRFTTARDAGLVGAHHTRYDDPRTKVRNPVEDTLNRNALTGYGEARRHNTPRAAEHILRERGFGAPQIQWIRDLIRRGVIQANTRRPTTGTAIG